MGSPSLTMKATLEAIKTVIADNITSGEHVEIAPALVTKQYTDIKYTVCPVDIIREHTDAQDGDNTIVIPRCIVRVWASIGLVGGEDGSFENAMIGIDAESKKGVCEALEWVVGILADNFLAGVAEESKKIEFDSPTFTVTDFVNPTAAAGSITITVTGSLTPSSESPLLFGTRTMSRKVPHVTNVQVTAVDSDSATITWDTNFASTSYVIWSEGSGNPLSNQTTEDDTPTTSHEVTVSGLNAGTYHEFRPCSRDPKGTRVGKSHNRYNFTTEAGGDIVFSDFSLGKQPVMQTVILYWTTDPATKDRSKWRIRGSSDAWNYTTLSISFNTNHTDNTSMPCTPGAEYEVRVYGETEGGYTEWDVLRFIKISAGGVPQFVN